MEVTEKTPVSTKPWFKKIADSLFGRPKQSVEAPVEIPPLPDLTTEIKTKEIPRIPQSPKISREERRAAQTDAYLKWKQQEVSQQTNQPKKIEVPIPSIIKTNEQTATVATLLITGKDLPWLDQQEAELSLDKITFVEGVRFFYGNIIYGKKLTEAANQLDEHRKEIADNLLSSHLPGFIKDGHHPYIKQVDGRITERPIYNVYNHGGQRVYFMRFDKLQDIPIIIRIAVCDKAREDEVLSIITNRSHKVIKQRSKL